VRGPDFEADNSSGYELDGVEFLTLTLRYLVFSFIRKPGLMVSCQCILPDIFYTNLRILIKLHINTMPIVITSQEFKFLPSVIPMWWPYKILRWKRYQRDLMHCSDVLSDGIDL
jgi:hypothetical protein